MLVPEKPRDEVERLQCLRSLAILDTEREERFDRVTRLARRLFNVPMSTVTLVDENRQWFKSCYGAELTETGRDVSFCGHAILGDEPFIITDASKDVRFHDNPLVVGPPFIRFYAGVPLLYRGKYKLGTLCIVDHQPKMLNTDQIRDLIDLAKIAEQELSALHEATIDELTQISNRRGFIKLASESLQNCQKYDEPFSLAFFDLNKFKTINDQWGHQAGDHALKDFAMLISQSFRSSDLFARVGGDEFVVLYTGMEEEETRKAIHRFERSVDEFNRNQHRPYQLSFSVGLYTLPPGRRMNLEDILAKADSRMYLSKKS
ncbi:sensor domain-containing diguanylate cyclase [Photobacterium sp. CCB-ST2H9]|uniref:sensor domain-containing diguanylate cyclase n=1 Tax=Photobacterium sp. CCB-ST2H9 TaxID=2912855 RepID=UPI0020054ADB|nr:sensor domain-containing diguanylate cyclase [Photobacterium sp. CCB-ST2H9]UTM59110.1 sensor domain-containing diguanylate cyclase [Photobacterium sp. CCB-ST2H9]